MHIPIAEILGYLDTKDDSLKSMIHSFANCKTVRRAEQLMEEIKCKEVEYNSTVRTRGNKPFCSIFFAATFFIRGDYSQASGHLQDAEMGFRGTGQPRNLAMALWIHALVYQKTNQAELAKSDFEKAINILEKISADYQRTGRYDNGGEFLSILKRIKQSASAPLDQSSPAGQTVQRRLGRKIPPARFSIPLPRYPSASISGLKTTHLHLPARHLSYL